MAVVTAAEVLANYRGPTVAGTLLDASIAEAERQITKRLGSLVDWVLLADGNRADLVAVVTRAVSELMNSPEGPYLLETESSYSYQVLADKVRSWITITPDMWAELGVVVASGPTSAYGFVMTKIPEGSPRNSWDYSLGDVGTEWSRS